MAVTHGTSTTFNFGTNLNSLGDLEWAISDQVDFTTVDAHDIDIGGKFVGGANIADGDTAEVYLAAPYDR